MSTATRALFTQQPIALAEIIAGADSKPRSWVMLLPEGKFSHHTYGEIDLSRKALDEMARHFHDKVRGIELALDYDHKASEGDSRAPGWLEDVEYRAAQPGNVPAGLWGKVRWTSIGLDDVRDERYRYISAEFKPTYKDELSGKTFHNVLIGATLTNRPFMKQMPAIALSQRSRRSSVRLAGKRFQSPGHYTKADRDKIPAEDFGDPENKDYPIQVAKDVIDAARLIGNATDKAEVIARIKAIARRKGFAIPKAWQTDGSTAASESAQVGSTAMALDEQESQFDPEDETDDASEEDFEEQEQDDADESEDEAEDGVDEEQEEVELADRASSGASGGGKGKSKASSQDDEDAEDQADGADDEADEGEALDDNSDSEDYAEEDDTEEEMPAPEGRAKGKAKMAGSSQKMSEAEAQAEIVRLSEENRAKDIKLREYETRDRVAKLGKTLRLSEKELREDGQEISEDRVALSKVLRDKYAAFLGSTKLSEGQLDKVAELLETAIKLGVVDLSARANNVEMADLDERRPRPQTREQRSNPDKLTERAEAIALNEHKMTLRELAVKNPEATASIYFRVEREVSAR